MPARALSASLEDYLEAIYHIVSARKVARPRDVARRLKVGNSSVTGALKALAEKGMIEYAPYDLVTLTAEGDARAREIARRHASLRDFLVKVLGVEEQISEEDACKMEHAISGTVAERLIRFVQFIERCPRWGETWVERFRKCEDDPPDVDQCRACIQSCLESADTRRESRAPSEGDAPGSQGCAA